MSPKKIILVDDEEHLIFPLKERLELRDFLVDAVLEGKKSIPMILENDYDLAIIDVKMPDISGLEVVSQVKEQKPDLPIILLSGHTTKENFDNPEKVGVHAYLSKPIQLKDLLLVMEEALS